MTPSPYLHITDTLTGQTARLVLDGELDYETTPDLEAAANDVLRSRPGLQALRLDCAKLRFCDTIGLAGLLQIRRATDDAGMSFTLDNRTTTLDRLLQITGLLPHLTNSNTHSAATSGNPVTG